ncbi:MAG: T9SS type A sorting domain-containing protein, partial [Bacteroidota bacterium]
IKRKVSWLIYEYGISQRATIRIPVDENGRIEIEATGGSQQYAYTWSTGDTTAQRDGLAAGAYDITVSDLSCGDLEFTALLRAPEELQLNSDSTLIVNASTAITSDGSIAPYLTGGTPPYTYLWDTGDTTAMLENLTVGDYVLQVTDANDCTFQTTFSVTVTTATLLPQSLLRFDVFPNPSKGIFQLRLALERVQAVEWRLMNIAGIVVRRELRRTSGLQEVVDVSHLPKGLYFLEVLTENGRVSRRIVLQ